jgi:energy-coupling factor transport system permease protein
MTLAPPRSTPPTEITQRDPRAWAVWLVAGVVLTMVGRNPLYLILLLAISRTVDAVCGQATAGGWSLPFWRLSAVILLFSTVFNMLMSHVGATVLFTLPEAWWLIGGPITLEAAVFGFVSGLSLVTLLSFFVAFSRVVPPHRLIQLVPRALHELGLVTLIAMTYLPQTIQQQRRLREAQAIRGRQTNGLSGWRPILIPLFVGGLERSLNLAETMVSRGFATTESRAQSPGARLLLFLALALALGGALWLAWGGAQGWLVVAAGVAVLAGAYWLLGRGVRHTRYRPQPWTWADTAVVAAALAPLVVLLLPVGWVDRSALTYAPYSGSLIPAFDVVTGLLLLLLAAPAVVELV